MLNLSGRVFSIPIHTHAHARIVIIIIIDQNDDQINIISNWVDKYVSQFSFEERQQNRILFTAAAVSQPENIQLILSSASSRVFCVVRNEYRLKTHTETHSDVWCVPYSRHIVAFKSTLELFFLQSCASKFFMFSFVGSHANWSMWQVEKCLLSSSSPLEYDSVCRASPSPFVHKQHWTTQPERSHTIHNEDEEKDVFFFFLLFNEFTYSLVIHLINYCATGDARVDGTSTSTTKNAVHVCFH